MALTQKEALLRTECFNNQEYVSNTLYIELLRGKRYKALVKTLFHLQKLNENLFIDWQGEEVKLIELNGVRLPVELLSTLSKENKIFFPAENLKQGLNQLLIMFENDYSTSGHGLHSFVDTADNQQYVYSQLEPHHCSKMFPCFDQPDLKGTYKLYALAPIEWAVISNEMRVHFNDPALLEFLAKYQLFTNQSVQEIWEFLATRPLSTYLYAILAGPYSEIKSDASLLHNGIPMSIFCRTSLLKHVQKDALEIFNLTTNGMRVFEQLFGYLYPFSKYDQIFCPEYSSGAMENAGAVTINDIYVFKEDVPKAQRADRQNTILHELSHMWFGDLVTMKWWDDLWLNESFAEFISHLCHWKIQPKEIEGVDVWVQFLERKIWGYVEDQMQTTHPIYCTVENTDQSENIFDGITYAKGAAILKQLFFMMGEKTFAKAMKAYFHKFQFRNSTLNDFFEVMQEAFNEDNVDIDLKTFREQWIMKAGLNQIEAMEQNGKLVIRQSPVLAQHPTLRDQRFRVAIYKKDGVCLQVKQLHVPPQEFTTFDDFDMSDIGALLLNFNDESFIKTLYNAQQVAFFLENLSSVEPSLSRVLILRSIWDQVRDGKTNFSVFVDGVTNHILSETDDTLNKMILQWCSGGIDTFTPRKLREGIRNRLTEMVLKMIEQTDKNNKNKLLVLKRYLAAWARDPKYLHILKPYIVCHENKEMPLGEIGLANGWKVIRNIYAFTDDAQKEALFNLWSQVDGTDEVAKQKRFLEALQSPNREALWQYFVNYKKEESVQMAAEAMAGFNHEIHIKDLEQYEGKYFDALPIVYKNCDSEYARTFDAYLFPKGDNLDYYQKRCEDLLAMNLGNDILTRSLKEAVDIIQRRKRTYATYPQESL